MIFHSYVSLPDGILIYKSGPTDFPSISHLVAALQHHGSSGTALSRMDVAHEKPRRAGEVGNDASFQPLPLHQWNFQGISMGDINDIFMEYSWNIDGICVEYSTDIEKTRVDLREYYRNRLGSRSQPFDAIHPFSFLFG